MESSPPSVTTYQGSSRTHQSRSSTGPISSSPPHTVIPSHHVDVNASAPVEDAIDATSLIANPSALSVLPDKRAAEEAGLSTVTDRVDAAGNDSNSKRRKLNSAAHSPLPGRDRSQHHAAGTGPGPTHLNPTPTRTNSAMDIDTLSQQQHLVSEGDMELESTNLAVQLSSPARLLPQVDAPGARKSPALEALSTYNCPICFSPPSFATLTPCGHVCCGECLFAAVKSSLERSAFHGPAAQTPRCPVCRAPIPGWDGKGGGVIGLQPRALRPGEST